MNFNSVEFLVLFLPLTFVAFYAVPMRLRLAVLILASLIFYGVSGLEVLGAFVIAILWGYATAFLFGRWRWPRPLAIAIAILVPGAFLVLFKYLTFILNIVAAGPETRAHFWFFLSVLLPAGISFYTFELVSYAIDVSDRKIEPDKSLERFAAFATFFPHLIAGPIMRYADLRGQLRALVETPILAPNLSGGLKLLAIGLFAKIFAADICGLLVAQAKSVPLDRLAAFDQLIQILLWSMQIYYDFWAYSLMAIGLGRLFCITLPINFREPYLSENPREFWRRWHVTLSYWLRDYVYIRMGGREHYLRNILIVFAAVGLWHGAGWNFVAWGVYHGILVILYSITAPAWDRLPRPLAVALCFTLVSFGWPLFFLSLGDYALFLRHLLVAPWHRELYGGTVLLYLGALGLVTFGLREENWLYNGPERRHVLTDSPVFAAILLFVSLMSLSLSQTFIYFRF